MSGIPSELKAIYLGKQTAFTTAVAITTKLMGVTEASLTVAGTVQMTPELGYLAPANLAVQTEQHGEGSISGLLTYQQAIYPLAGIFGNLTLATSGSTAVYWNFHAPSTGGSNITTTNYYTVQQTASAGTTLSAQSRLEGAVIKGFNISGEAQGVWNYRMDMESYRLTSTALTTAYIGDPNVDPVRFADTSFYMDAWASTTMGGTAVSGTLIRFELDGNTNRHLKRFAGSMYPQSVGNNRWDGTLTTVVEYNSTVRTLVDALMGGVTQRQLRIVAEVGAAPKQTVQLNFAGTLSPDGATELFSDEEGNIVVELVWEGTYNPTYLGWLKMRVINSQGSL